MTEKQNRTASNSVRGSLYAASIIVVMAGLAVYALNVFFDETLGNGRPASSHLASDNTQHAANEAAKTGVVVRGPAKGAVVLNTKHAVEKRISAAPHAAGSNQSPMPSGSSMLAESILSAHAKVRKISGSRHAGLGLAQRNAQLKYRVSTTRQQIAFVRRQLQQSERDGNPERTANRPVSGKKMPDQKAMELASLQSRVHHLQYQLAMQRQTLTRFQRQFPASSLYAKSLLSSAMQQRIHRRFN